MTRGQLARLSKQVADPRPRNALDDILERTLAAMKQQSPANPPPAPAAANEDTETRPTREQAAEKFKESMAVIASSFDREKLDPVWSKQAASQVAAAFEADGLVRRSETGLEVTDTGRLFIRNIAMCFDNTLASSSERKHSRTI